MFIVFFSFVDVVNKKNVEPDWQEHCTRTKWIIKSCFPSLLCPRAGGTKRDLESPAGGSVVGAGGGGSPGLHPAGQDGAITSPARERGT